MAPSLRASKSQTKKSQSTISFNRISKPVITSKLSDKISAKKQLALDKLYDNQSAILLPTTPHKTSASQASSPLGTPKSSHSQQRPLNCLHNEEKPQRQLAVSTTPAKKRKHDGEESDSDNAEDRIQFFSGSKKAKITLPTPRSSPVRESELDTEFQRVRRSKSPGNIPETIKDLFLIHKYFVRAFSLHRAHNGTSTDADTRKILDSVTRLYQKRTVTVLDLQRMLALYEISAGTNIPPSTDCSHDESPFKLITIGTGRGKREMVAFVGFPEDRKHPVYDEADLIASYDTMMVLTCRNNQKCKDSFLYQPIEEYPVLHFEVGAQTIARQAKVSQTRDYILGGRKTEIDVGKLSIRDEEGEINMPKIEQTVKSRTLSLFDRVKAKQLANSSVEVPSADAVRRKHALGRVAEIVEILRMKQQQKLGAYRGAGNNGKASFSLQQIVGEIKASMSIPMAESEIKLCVEVMSKEMEGGWLKVFELGVTKTVVLTGAGISGVQVAKLLKA